jgi:hypothetical protein
LLFELIYQRTKDQQNLLLVLDEPFAGVTDDFVDFIVNRLNLMRQQHNILLVTNDHVEVLKNMADNYLRVSAVNRTLVQINDDVDSTNVVDRETAILALSVGECYRYDSTTWNDLRFFVTVEIYRNASFQAVAIFIAVAFGLFTITFWNSTAMFGPFVVVAASIISFFCLHPYLLSLVDWRNYMTEEAEALLHSSKSVNKILKTTLTLTLILVVSIVEYCTINLIMDGFGSRQFWIAMLMDNASLTFPFIFLGLFTKLPETRVQVCFHDHSSLSCSNLLLLFRRASKIFGPSLLIYHAVYPSIRAYFSSTIQIFGAFPFILLIFFSGTFSPSAGLPGLKALRYLFVRYYFWCLMPTVSGMMEDCPNENVITLYMILAALVGTFLFLTFVAVRAMVKAVTAQQKTGQYDELHKDRAFRDLQLELYGEQAGLYHQDKQQQQKQPRRRGGGPKATDDNGTRSVLSVLSTASDEDSKEPITAVDAADEKVVIEYA